MPTFTTDELRRISKTLHRRLQRLDPDNFVAVGLGQALKAEQLDHHRGLTVCVYLRRKLARVPRGKRIDKQVTVRLKRDAHFETFTFPTDVIPVGDLQGSAAYVEHRGNQFVVGARIQWRLADAKDDQRGWLTVAHPFFGTAPRNTAANGLDDFTLLTRSRRGSPFDAAVIRPSAQEDSRLDDKISLPLAVASLAYLQDAPGRGGESIRPEGPVSLQVQAFLPTLPLAGVGNLVNVVSAIGRQQTFEPGTSGAIWWVDGTPAAMQVAGRARSFSLGFGQALTSTLVWCEAAIERRTPGAKLDGPVELIGAA